MPCADRQGHARGNSAASEPDEQVVADERADCVAVERVPRAEAHHGAAEAMLADEGDRRHKVKRRAVPDGLQELAVHGEARLGVEAAAAVDEDVALVVAHVARRREELSYRHRHQVLAARRVGARKRSVAERLGRHVEEDALVADHRVPRDGAVDAQVALAVLRRQEQQEVAARPAERDRLLYRDVRRVAVARHYAGVLYGLDERQRGLVEERRVAGVDLEEDVVHAEPRPERDDVLDHA